MARRRGHGKHPKRKGPGGPVRPMSSAPSRRVSGGGSDGRTGSGAPTDGLVDALLQAFQPANAGDDAVQAALVLELDAVHLAPTLIGEAGAHVGPMLRAAAEGLASRGSARTDQALAALAYVHHSSGRSKLAPFSRSWAERRTRSTDPVALAIGQDEITGVVETGHVMGDGVNLTLALDNPLGPYTVALYVDHNLSGLAKDVIAGPPITEVRAMYRAADGFYLRDLSLEEAAWRVDQAVDLTQHTIDPPTSEDFDDLLPLLQHRLRSVPRREPASMVDDDGHVIGFVEVTRAERLAHLGAFRVSPEFEAIASDAADDAFEVVDLFIDHAVDYTIGTVRRISPVLVELFCVSWFPRKVVADRAMVDAAPAGIEAWLRFCARTTGLDDRWLDECLDSLATYAPHLRDALDDPAAWGLGKRALSDLSNVSGLGDVAGLRSGLPPRAGELLDDLIDDEVDAQMTSWLLPEDLAWETPEQGTPGERVHVEADPSGVPIWQYGKTKLIASQVSVQAAALLGPSFAQPAMELAIAIGSADPCPYDNSQIRSWPGAIIWLLAEDSDVFSSRTVGHRRDDLAEALPMTKATYQAKAKKIREVLGLQKGARRVAW